MDKSTNGAGKPEIAHGNPMTRRQLIGRVAGSVTGLAVAGAAGAALSSLIAPDAAFARDRYEAGYGPFKMGMQSYSLRGYDLDRALAETRALGLKYWEAFPQHVPETTDPHRIHSMREKFRHAGIQLLHYGVVGFGGDAAANRREFEFARAMGIRVLSADPDPAAFDSLNRLVDEFRINIAIHNHGPGARYSSLESVTDAIKGQHFRIGACVDTGHYLRSGVDPVKAVRTIGRRVFGVHLKDVKGGDRFTPLGEGDLDIVGLLKVLHGLHYHNVMALEYEDHPENPIPDIITSLAAVRAAVLKI